MILLVDSWTRQAALLQYSLQQAGQTFETVCIQYDGFLPEDVASPYRFFMERSSAVQDRKDGGGELLSPLFFDELQVPENWEIRGTGSSGQVMDYDRERARIFYAEPKNRRLVKVTDWLDRNGNVRFSEHYDAEGRKYAVSTLWNHRMICRIYYDTAGREVLTENYVTGAILLRYGGKEHIFPNREEFVCYYLRTAGLAADRIFYNSLSTPFLVAEEMAPQRAYGNILFWQEPIRDTIPGNMILLMNGTGGTRIAVQTDEAYRKLVQKVHERNGAGREIRDPDQAEKMLCRVGYVYPYRRTEAGRDFWADSYQEAGADRKGSVEIYEGAGTDRKDFAESYQGAGTDRKDFAESYQRADADRTDRENGKGRSVLILTNSDQIAGLEQLVSDLPKVRFDIAALTEMSDRLTSFGRFSNVHLYPGCSEEEACGRLDQTDALLDINHGSEIVDSVFRAFLREIPVLAFETTVHNRDYEAEENIFSADDRGRTEMEERIREILSDPEQYRESILAQKRKAMDETAESFRRALGED